MTQQNLKKKRKKSRLLLDLDLITLGKIIAAHGVKGHLKIKTRAGLSLKLQEGTWLFLIIQKKPVPFLCVEETIIQDTVGSILLNGIDSPEKAREFSGVDVALENSLLENDNLAVTSSELSNDLLAYEVFDGDRLIGTVSDLYDNAGQTLLAVQSPMGEHLIPLVDEFVKEIKKEPKQIILELPESLL